MLHIQYSEAFDLMELEGYLKKFKPDVKFLKQKRYCRFLDQGRLFAYAKKKEDFVNGNIKGQIPIKDIVKVTDDDKHHPERFSIHVVGREYKFKAENVQEKNAMG